MSMGEFYTVTEAADYISVHPQTIRNWYRHNLLIAYRPNPRGKILIKKSDLDSILKDGIMGNNNGKEAITTEN